MFVSPGAHRTVAGSSRQPEPRERRDARHGEDPQGAEVDFSVEKDDGRFEVEVDIDDARPGSKYRVILKHDGKRYLKKVFRADRDGDIEIDRKRPDTRGKDVFKVKVKKIGGGAKSRVIQMR